MPAVKPNQSSHNQRALQAYCSTAMQQEYLTSWRQLHQHCQRQRTALLITVMVYSLIAVRANLTVAMADLSFAARADFPSDTFPAWTNLFGNKALFSLLSDQGCSQLPRPQQLQYGVERPRSSSNVALNPCTRQWPLPTAKQQHAATR